MIDVLERPANETESRPSPPPRQPQNSGGDTQSVLLAAELVPTVMQISELVNLPSNWNSYGALPVSQDAAFRTIRLLADLKWRAPLPAVIPMPSGGLQLAWGGDNDTVEVRIPSNGPISILIDIGGEMTESEVDGAMDPFLAKALSWAARLA